MTPDHVAMLAAMASLVDKLGTWPMASLVLCIFLSPWLMLITLFRSQEKKLQEINNEQERRFAAVRQMYENNVELVRQGQDMSKNLKDLIVLNTEVMTRLTDDIRSNQYCPANRR